MKLRLFDQSIRVRLSRPEVALLAEAGRLSERLAFPTGQALEYALETGPALAVSFEGACLAITLPAGETKHWAESAAVAISGASGPLRISVEKDFQCLHGPESENADAFPNPAAAK